MEGVVKELKESKDALQKEELITKTGGPLMLQYQQTGFSQQQPTGQYGSQFGGGNQQQGFY